MSSIIEAKDFDKSKYQRMHAKTVQEEAHRQEAHEADMQVWQKHPSPETMPGIWEDMCGMQGKWPFQSSVQRQEDQGHE